MKVFMGMLGATVLFSTVFLAGVICGIAVLDAATVTEELKEVKNEQD